MTNIQLGKMFIFRMVIASLITLLFCSATFITGCSKNKKDIYQGLTADQIYTRGQTNMKTENYSDAIKDFEALEARYPYSEYSHEAQLSLINAYYKKNEPAQAISAVDRFLRMNPRHPKVDYAYYLKGLINFDQNSTFIFRHLPLDRSARDTTSAQESFDAFRDLVEHFPKSEYVADARQRMVHLKDQLARHEMAVVDYYIRRGAFLSAASRANYIVKHFEQTSAIPEALRALVISYRKMGMAQLADEAHKTLMSNFPKSDALRGL